MSVQRQEWAEFIRTRDYTWRFVHTRSGSTLRDAEEVSQDALNQFLSALPDSSADTRFLARLYFLCQPRLQAFIADDLPELLRSCSRVTSPVDEKVFGAVRGKVDWPRTYRDRLAQRLETSTFLVRRRVASYDVPENQLLKLFLTETSEAIGTLANKAGTGALARSLLNMGQQIEAALKQTVMRDVSRRYEATSLMRKRAARSRNWRYEVMADLQSDLEALLDESHWETVLSLLQRNWLEPIDTDDLFEIYTLVYVLDLLRSDMGFGPPKRVNILRAGRKEVAEFQREADGMLVRVYFDQSPVEIFSTTSVYESLLRQYEGIGFNARRPDIVMRFIAEDGTERRLLVECKRSDDDAYKRDSVYKALGYLQDFASLWDDIEKQQPKAIVVFPSNIKPKSDSALQFDVALVSVDDSRLAQLISASLKP